MRESTSDNSQTLSNYTELYKLRKSAARRSKFLSVTVLVLISVMLGVWVHAEWAVISARATTEFDKADAYVRSTF
jgi:hypothetical protein